MPARTRSYYRVNGAFLRPKPIQNYPALMSAGGSPKGRSYAAEHCDIALTSFAERELASMRKRLESYTAPAHDRFGHELRIWITACVVPGGTEEDAQRQFDQCITEKGDFAGLDNPFRRLGINGNNQSHTAGQLRARKHDFMAGWGGCKLQGTKERIVEDLWMLVAAGVHGVLLSWPAFIPGLARFKEEVHTLLVQEGLR